MKDVLSGKFTGIEAEKRKSLNSLMNDWRNEVSSSKRKDRDDRTYHGNAYFAADGFFPGYYKQKNKVLFIGREARYINGDKNKNYQGDYLVAFLDWLNNPSSNFMRRVLTIAQLIKSEGQTKFEDLQSANDYAKEMIKTGDFGFAIMNISKYSNEAKDAAKADKTLINDYFEHTHLEKRNFFQEELELLKPDIIITSNLWQAGLIAPQYLDLCFGFGKRMQIAEIPDVSTLSLMLVKGKIVKLVDVFAFPSRKPKKEYYYTPIKKLLFSRKDKQNPAKLKEADKTKIREFSFMGWNAPQIAKGLHLDESEVKSIVEEFKANLKAARRTYLFWADAAADFAKKSL